tara:strand:+ start:1893 stop:3110 length:1218 start_codon:yes stop_codon:yes gene_type:complete
MSQYDLKFINHACIAFENDEELILTDPWFMGDVFNNSWSLLENTNLENLNLEKLTTIFYTHEHPDHLSWETLKSIREKVSQEIMIVYKRRDNKNILNRCRELGFEFAEIDPNVETELRDNFTVGLFPQGKDSALVYRVNDKVILNQNDCHLDYNNIQVIKSIYPKIDVWLMQFGLAGYYANRDDLAGLNVARETHLKMIEEYYSFFQPNIFVPFASFVYFCKKYNSFLNDVQLTPDDVYDRFTYPNYPTQIVYYGDNILNKDWSDRNATNLKKWKNIFQKNKKIKDLKKYSESDILDSADKLMSEDFTKSRFGSTGPTEIHLELFDLDKIFSLDFSTKSYSFLNKDKIDYQKLAGKLPMEELYSFLNFPWGADTLNITSCFDKLNNDLWTSMLVYRDSLYVGIRN